MSKSITVPMWEPATGHQAMTLQLWPWIKAMLMAGHKLSVKACVQEDDRTLVQNRFYWSAACLGAIAEQAKVAGIGYEAEAWHNLFKRKFLGYEIKKEKVAGSKRVKVIRRLRSTTDLKVRAMNVYLEQVQAYATTELSVTFDGQDWREWVDPLTGEIRGLR
jgi:hypothetical protein